jgi:hypothetical protein
VHEVVVETPDMLCAGALAARLGETRASLEPVDGDAVAVRTRVDLTELPALLAAVRDWLADYDIRSVGVHVDGRGYTLAQQMAPSPLRQRDPNELPRDLVLDA